MMSMKTFTTSFSALELTVYNALLRAMNPEVGENIVSPRLVYGIKVEGNSTKVTLIMTTSEAQWEQ